MGIVGKTVEERGELIVNGSFPHLKAWQKALFYGSCPLSITNNFSYLNRKPGFQPPYYYYL